MIKLMKTSFLFVFIILALFAISPAFVSAEEKPKENFDDVEAIFRKIVPRKINIKEINLFMPEMEIKIPSDGIYGVEIDGGELIIGEDGKDMISQKIIVTMLIYIDVFDREPGIGTIIYDDLITKWDKSKGELIQYEVKMPPYEAAYHGSKLGDNGKAPYEVNILSPIGSNFLVKISLSTNKEGIDYDRTIAITKDLIDYIARKAIDVEVESVEKDEKKGK